MKDSDLKKENLKKAGIISGIAVGAAAIASGTTYAANQMMNVDADDNISDADIDVYVEQPAVDDQAEEYFSLEYEESPSEPTQTSAPHPATGHHAHLQASAQHPAAQPASTTAQNVPLSASSNISN